MKKLVAALVALLATGSLVSIATPSLATPTSGVSYYISPPFVQGSYVTSDVTRVDFNSLSTGSNACSVTSGPVTVQGQDCSISNAGQCGGAQAGANDATPTVGGVGSRYASTASTTEPVVVEFSAPMKYLGFWWSAGSLSNQVTFYSGPMPFLL